MRQLLLIMVLLLIAAGLYADIIIKPDFNFGLINAPVYNIDLRYSNSLQRLYVTAKFDIDYKALPKTTYHSFFLTKDAHLEQLCISAKICGYIMATDLVPEHFVPDFHVPALLDSTSNSICYSFNLEPLISQKEKISFRLVYWLDMPPLDSESGGFSTGISTDTMWFPRNLSSPSVLNMSVTTSDKFQVRMGEYLNYSDENSIRTHYGTYQDEPNKYFELKLIKSLN